MATRIKASDDLTLIIHGKQGLDIHSDHGAIRNYTGIAVTAAELPALLDRLNAAAEAMGVATAYAALLELAKAIEGRYALYDGANWTCRYCGMWAENLDTLNHRDDCEVRMARQAIAKAEQ